MMIRKKLFRVVIIIAGLFVALWAASLITGYSLAIALHDPGVYLKKVEVKPGKKIHVLKDLNFDEGRWTAYIILGNDDRRILKEYRRNCYQVCDKAILNQLKQNWEMVITSGDVVTATSSVIFVKDGFSVWSSGVVIDDGLEGFQSPVFGWAKPVKKGAIKDSLKLFSPVYAPLVIL